ncbi:MAG: FAD-dependent oxidoreductase [Alphaproteobacteria bacterium]|nr:FAD-dependent oxidoreductase [Alphaproteobacteria bacterium]
MPVLPASDARFDHKVEVLVIGAGACGLTAALAAGEGGAEVLVLERDETPTGSTTLSTGLIPAAGTRLQRAAGIDDSPEQLAADFIGKAKGKTDEKMARLMGRVSAPTVEWLMERHGVEMNLVTGFLYPGHSRLRMHGTPNRTGQELEAALLAAAGRAEIDILTGALASDLYATPEGRVVAVRVTRPDGKQETVGCEALVLACSGFGGNRDMVRDFIPEIAEAEYWGHVGNKGDAVKWGMALGAATADMGSYQGHGAVATPHGNPIVWGVLMEGGIQVNALGERFSDETLGYSEQAVVVVKQPGHVAWNIYDEQREKTALQFTDYREVLSLGGIRRANTIAELARECGLPADALGRTIAAVEEMRAGHAKDTYGRDFTGKPPFAPPYCAVKVTGALFHTQGGLVVDEDARVLRPDGRALPNLFAGGGAARGLSGPSRWGYLAGAGLLTATGFGRLAGIAAAKQVRGGA